MHVPTVVGMTAKLVTDIGDSFFHVLGIFMVAENSVWLFECVSDGSHYGGYILYSLRAGLLSLPSLLDGQLRGHSLLS